MLDVDADAGLKGECDFILARRIPLPELRAPLMIVVEAERNEVESGLAECAAQMVAAGRFNEAKGEARRRMHGCCTNGEAWQFLRLDGTDLRVDTNRYYLKEQGVILGIIVSALKEYDPR